MLLKNTDEADNEDYDGADVLDDDRRVRNERPEVIRLESRIALKVFEEGILIRVVVRICPESAMASTSSRGCSQDCFTHNSFFQVPFLLRLELRFPSLRRPRLGGFGVSSAVICRSLSNVVAAAGCFLGSEPW